MSVKFWHISDMALILCNWGSDNCFSLITLIFSELTHTCVFNVVLCKWRWKRVGHIGLPSRSWCLLMTLMECTVFIGASRAERFTRHLNKSLLKKKKVARDAFVFRGPGSPSPCSGALDQKHMLSCFLHVCSMRPIAVTSRSVWVSAARQVVRSTAQGSVFRT